MQLDPGRGTYLVRVRLDRARVVVVRRRIGRGRWARSRIYRLAAGEYLYVGSALGPGGLAARVGRHLSSGAGKAPHWDIDFLLSRAIRPARLEAWGLPACGDGLECRWARAIAAAKGSRPVVGRLEGSERADRGFGAGDCRSRCGCPEGGPASLRTHLFRAGFRPDLPGMRRLLGAPLVALRLGASRPRRPRLAGGGPGPRAPPRPGARSRPGPRPRAR